jgi:hypothetical protein
MKSLAVFACASAMCATACVSQQTYDKTRAEADETRQTLESERAELREMEQQIASLQALNRTADAVTTETRTAIQREMDAAALYRQRADDKLAALQTQAAYLVNQNRALGRELADAKQEGASLQGSVAQYKRELDEFRLAPLPAQSTPSTSSSQFAPPPSPSSPAPIPAPVVTQPAAPAVPPQQVQAGSPPPVKPIAPRPAKAEQVETEESWTGMIKGWVTTIWEWIFG